MIAELNAAKLCDDADRDASRAGLGRSTRPRTTTRNTSARNPSQPYCAFVVEPKVAKFRKHFLAKVKK